MHIRRPTNLARSYVEVCFGAANARSQLVRAVHEMLDSYRDNGTVTAEQHAAATSEEAIDDLLERSTREMTRFFSKTYTLRELEVLLGFSETTLGKKLMSQQENMSRVLAEVGEVWGLETVGGTPSF